MQTAISIDCTLCLNTSNHPSIPEQGLVLEAGVRTAVTPEQADYLRSLSLDVQDNPDPKSFRVRRAYQE
jgi:hypothetical protein